MNEKSWSYPSIISGYCARLRQGYLEDAYKKGAKEREMKMNERTLPDDYLVYASYWYVADGKPVRSPIEGTVRQHRNHLGASEIKSCDTVARDLEFWD